MTKPRIAICGIHIESSTFTPYVSNEEDFEVLRGEEVLGRYRWINDDWSRQVDWFPILHARALPGGVVSRNAYGGWKQEIVDGLQALVAREPLDGVFFDIHGAMSVQGLEDAVWIGFAWADQPRCKGAVVVTGDDARDVALQAKILGQAFWDARDDFEFVAPTGTMEQCLEVALDGPTPFFISDSGDNPGAGGAGDTTAALKAVLDWEPVRARTEYEAGTKHEAGTKDVIFASILDPAAATTCWQAGVGQVVTVSVGGKVDDEDPGPVDVTGEVTALHDDPRGGKTAVIRTGGLHLIVTTNRNQYTELEQFLALGLDPREADLVVVKIGYLEPDLYQAQKGWMMALSPGGVNQDLLSLPYRNIDRPMFPFDEFDTEPDLEAVIRRP